MSDFQAVRTHARNFCAEREWEKYNLPRSLALALAGECGEVCEIFQWKPSCTEYTEREIEHIGEEVADVMIYTTRLCDICNIDLARSVENTEHDDAVQFRCRPNESWDELALDSVSSAQAQTTSRGLCFALQAAVGKLCESFSSKTEGECAVGLPHWDSQQIVALAHQAGKICLVLGSLAKLHGLSLSRCVSDKFIKNARKYPAEASRGSSAKYTAYTSHAKSTTPPSTSTATSTGVVARRNSAFSWGSLLVGAVRKVAIGVGLMIVLEVAYGFGVQTGLKVNFERETRVQV